MVRLEGANALHPQIPGLGRAQRGQFDGIDVEGDQRGGVVVAEFEDAGGDLHGLFAPVVGHLRERDRRLAYLGRSRSVDRDGGRMGFQESKTGEDSIGCHTRGTGLEFDFKQSEFPLQSPVVRGPSD